MEEIEEEQAKEKRPINNEMFFAANLFVVDPNVITRIPQALSNENRQGYSFHRISARHTVSPWLQKNAGTSHVIDRCSSQQWKLQKEE